jgi:hypothetical protein
MKAMGLAGIVAAMAIALAAPAQAAPEHDYDTDFMNEIHQYGIYGPQDYDAWLAKITCERMRNGTDADAHKSQAFILRNLPRGTTEGQSWQFLGAAVGHYCPDQAPRVQAAGV